MIEIAESLRNLVPGRVQEQEPMRKHTNFRIGGPARFFVEIKTIDELTAVLSLAKQHNIETGVIGGGSNVLVADQGFEGIMIKISMRDWKFEDHRVTAEAGVPMILLARKAGEVGLSGLEWAITLPGTVGGAVRGNAGCFGGETRDRLIEATVLSEGEVVTRTNAQLQFGYRESSLKHSKDIVLSATFELEPGEKEEILARMNRHMVARKHSQPTDGGSAGCLFKNYEIPSEEDLQRILSHTDLPSEVITARRLSAGWVIDQVGLKGFHIGDACVSEKHGNFLVNKGNATADQVVQLIAVIKTRVRNQYGITLQEEVQYMGFNH